VCVCACVLHTKAFNEWNEPTNQPTCIIAFLCCIAIVVCYTSSFVLAYVFMKRQQRMDNVVGYVLMVPFSIERHRRQGL